MFMTLYVKHQYIFGKFIVTKQRDFIKDLSVFLASEYLEQFICKEGSQKYTDLNVYDKYFGIVGTIQDLT